MSETKIPSALPTWIPWGGQYVYDVVNSGGGYSDSRVAAAFDSLFHSPRLEGWWSRLAAIHLSADGWSHLIGAIVMAVECVPVGGRATRDRPDEKVRILEQQKEAGRLIEEAAKKARELADLLAELEQNGGSLPAESYSGLALIEAAIESERMSSACWQRPFAEFRKSMSSYAKSRFPDSYQILDTFALRLEQFPAAKDVFADDPWLSCSHSTWKNYPRILRQALQECEAIYGTAPQFTDAEWTVLLNLLLGLSLSQQEVAKGLKEL